MKKINTAGTSNASYVAIENLDTKMWGLQFHPKVTHSPLGPAILKNFVVTICSAQQDWVMTDYAQEFIDTVRDQVGPTGHVIGAVSGGVDTFPAKADQSGARQHAYEHAHAIVNSKINNR